jgi:hypothetical protein
MNVENVGLLSIYVKRNHVAESFYKHQTFPQSHVSSPLPP